MRIVLSIYNIKGWIPVTQVQLYLQILIWKGVFTKSPGMYLKHLLYRIRANRRSMDLSMMKKM
jgi:hypothetical protein